MNLITETYQKHIKGILSCYDRIAIQGTLPYFCYAEGMTSFLYANKIRIFDYPLFAQSLRDELRDNAERIASENDLEIEFIRKNNFRKEKRIKNILKQRGDHPGIVHIFSVMEACTAYKPWHDKKSHKTFLKTTSGKCLHYYFYFIDPDMGLCYVRLPTWCPFRLQIYFNGHNHLASELRKKKMQYTLLDNSFVEIENFSKAQAIADDFDIAKLHEKLDTLAKTYCPVIRKFNLRYHWSIMQAEYATDIIFKKQKELNILYEQIIRTSIHTVKPENIATFLGRKLHGNYQDEMGNQFNTRIEGTRVRHSMGPVSLKMYDKFSLVLRIETTVNNVNFFKHYRMVEHKNGTKSKKFAQMKKSIYSLSPLTKLLLAANRRYIEFISAFDDYSAGVKKINKICKSIIINNRSYKGFNFFSENDQIIFEKIMNGEFLVTGFRNKTLRERIPDSAKPPFGKNVGQVSRIIKRLRVHGLIKKVRNSYKYYPTKYGIEVITAGLKLKNLYLIPVIS